MRPRFQDENGEWYNEYDLYGYEGYEDQVIIQLYHISTSKFVLTLTTYL